MKVKSFHYINIFAIVNILKSKYTLFFFWLNFKEKVYSVFLLYVFVLVN